MAGHWRDLVGDIAFHAGSTALPRWVNPDAYSERLPSVPQSTAKASALVGVLRTTLSVAARDAIRRVERVDNEARLSDEAKAADVAGIGRDMWHRLGTSLSKAAHAVRDARSAHESRVSARRARAVQQIIDPASAAELRQLLTRLGRDEMRKTIRAAVLDGSDPDVLAALGAAHVAVRKRLLEDADLSENVFRKVTASWESAEPDFDSTAEAELLADLERSVSLGFTVFELAGARLDSSGVPADDRAEGRIVEEIRYGKTAAELGIEGPDPVLPSPDVDDIEEPAA